MKKYLVYQTDNWHTRASKDLIALASTKNKAISLIKKYVKKVYGEKISEDDLYMLTINNQTQGFAGEGEFVIESIEQNILL